MIIAEAYDVKVNLGDLEISEIPGGRIESLDIQENIYDGIPTLGADIVLPKEVFKDHMIADGTKINIELSGGGLTETKKNKNSLVFNICDITSLAQQGDVMVISFNANLDVYEMYRDANLFNLFANSSDIFKKVADTYKLNADIDLTNDQQLWVAGKRNLLQFLHHLSKYGYCDETSCMIWFFDREKRFVYKNMTKLLKQASDIWTFEKKSLGDFSNKKFGYNEIEVSLFAGTNNILNGGYGIDFDVFNLESYQNQKVIAKKVVAESAGINISKDLSQGLNYNWFPIDVGNFHQNYYKAYAQNMRIKSTYSTYIKLRCQYLQKYHLGEVVDVIYRDTANSDNKNKTFSMRGIIHSLHTIIKPNMVGSEIEIAAQGINSIPKSFEIY